MILLAFLLSIAQASEPTIYPSFAEVKERVTPSDLRVLDRKGRLIGSTRRDASKRRLSWTKLEEVPPVLIRAVLSAEDRRFFDHSGVDFKALLRGAWNTWMNQAPQGASTLTMQLSQRLENGVEKGRWRATRRRDLFQKWDQIQAARALEKEWKKDEILETYLNLVSFRGEVEGIEAASRLFFAKSPSALTREESVVLAALIRSPQAPIDQIQSRGCALARELYAGFDCEGPLKKASQAIVRGQAEFRNEELKKRILVSPNLHVVQYMREKYPNARGDLRTSLDAEIQTQVDQILRDQVGTLTAKNANDAAAIVLDRASGNVLAYVGSVLSDPSKQFVDGVRAKRQAGSTLKPFLYASALDRKLLTAASLIDDSETDLVLGDQVYRPKNYDSNFHGPVSLRQSLGSSLNVPAVKALGMLGVDRFVHELERLGIQGLKSPGFYGPSLALGSVDVTLEELTRAYRALSLGTVYSKEASFIVTDVLSDPEARQLGFGLDNPLSLRTWSAAKTGTSQDMRDNWCVGFTDRFVVGVWVGNFDGSPMWNVSGISGAAPAWAEIVGRLHQREPAKKLLAPSRLVRRAGEWWMAGTEPSESWSQTGPSKAVPAVSAVSIIYPPEGLVVAIDPDIPASRQKLSLQASRYSAEWKWFVNGEELASAEKNFDLPLKRRALGPQKIELRDPRGVRLAESQFILK